VCAHAHARARACACACSHHRVCTLQLLTQLPVRHNINLRPRHALARSTGTLKEVGGGGVDRAVEHTDAREIRVTFGFKLLLASNHHLHQTAAQEPCSAYHNCNSSWAWTCAWGGLGHVYCPTEAGCSPLPPLVIHKARACAPANGTYTRLWHIRARKLRREVKGIEILDDNLPHTTHYNQNAVII
jgi:hypothetical protein